MAAAIASFKACFQILFDALADYRKVFQYVQEVTFAHARQAIASSTAQEYTALRHSR